MFTQGLFLYILSLRADFIGVAIRLFFGDNGLLPFSEQHAGCSLQDNLIFRFRPCENTAIIHRSLFHYLFLSPAAAAFYCINQHFTPQYMGFHQISTQSYVNFYRKY